MATAVSNENDVTKYAGVVTAEGQVNWPPPKGNPNFSLEPPSVIDFQQVIERAGHNLEIKVPITAAEFEDRFNKAKEALLVRMPNLRKNVILAGLRPPILKGDLGFNVKKCVTAAGRGYKAIYPNRVFHDNCGDLTGRVEVVQATGYQRIMDIRELLVVVYVCDCMRARSVSEQRNPPAELIEFGACIAGPFELCVLGQYPEVLANGWKCPGIDYPGAQIDNGGRSLCAGACGGYLSVYVYEAVGARDAYYSGAVVFPG